MSVLLQDTLRNAVHASGLSYAEIGRRAGYSRHTVASVVRGRNGGRVDTWENILMACNVEVGWRLKKEEQ
jgi:transcriptional regulator with XRE-family HTH domain